MAISDPSGLMGFSYTCAHCGVSLFSQESFLKADGRCLCFSQPIKKDAVSTCSYRHHGIPKIGVNCGKCRKHIGDLYGESKSPTGRRYCMSGVSASRQDRGKRYKSRP